MRTSFPTRIYGVRHWLIGFIFARFKQDKTPHNMYAPQADFKEILSLYKLCQIKRSVAEQPLVPITRHLEQLRLLPGSALDRNIHNSASGSM